ncbi:MULTISPECIES: antitoxin [Gordonia]|jgi:hypothetical protein|uniref:Antitoxin n=2 Tax=Gordonia alkanivorans TaxID=84096 RepID=F9VYC5_9ACTN|nr:MULTISPECIES: antitoxin [Gordonia]AZZ83256.1 antitoxin [Gordonia alkanivorans]ETA06964.1 hypothetical protein V525_10710 [Gordonia alkanivorans CGMCC 6845]MDH3008532.1 antitoxin [Gordonia alkanivorans]MDH3013351.1 antitoxin [Gordonia alkanivorans]MDH3017712.1 antitoxin [Gordonia alkanivorans]
MDLKGLVNKARDTLRKNPNLIEKGGDAIDKATGNKYAGQVDKAQDAVRKAVGAQNTAAQNNKTPENNKAPENKPDAPQQ